MRAVAITGDQGVRITARAIWWPETALLQQFRGISCLNPCGNRRYRCYPADGRLCFDGPFSYFGMCEVHEKRDDLCDSSCRNGRNLLFVGPGVTGARHLE